MIICISTQFYLFLYNTAEKKNVALSQLLEIFTSPVASGIIIIYSLTIIFLLYKKPEILPLYKKFYIFLLIIGAVIVLVVAILSNTIGLGELDKFLKITDSWGNYRGGIWKQLLDLYKDFSLKEKLFGIGPESLYKIAKPLEVHGNKNLDQAHNEYLQYLMTTGLFGALSYLFVIIAVIVSVIKNLKRNALAVALLAGLVSFWTQAAFNIAQPFTTPIMYVFIAVIGAMVYIERNKDKITSEKVFI